MRTPALLFFCLLALPLLKAQNYVPVIINGEVFFKTELETDAGPIDAEVTVANFEQIDGQLYNRVFFKRGFEADMLVGYLREDPGAGQMFFRTTTSSNEFLIYDIALTVGSVISLQARWCDGRSGDLAEVVAVRTSAGRRELVFDRQVGQVGICDTLRFIEGVGPSASVIFPYFRNALLPNGVAQRICHASRGGAIFYPPNTTTDLCGLTITSTADAPTSTTLLTVYPNLVRDQLTIAGLEPGQLLEVYTATGQLILRTPATASLDCSSWARGIYFLRAAAGTGLRTARIVVVN